MFRSLLVIFSFFVFSLSAHADDSGVVDEQKLEKTYKVSKKNYDKLSRAVVLVKTTSGYGSGTLFKVKKNIIVLTAAHVVEGYDVVSVEHDGKAYLATVVLFDEENDVSILSAPEVDGRDPIGLKLTSSATSVGDRISYCGFPNRQDISCFSGEVSQVSDKHINVHTYAWMGASGSVMVDKKGRVVGILSGIEVGRAWGSYHLIEDVVWMRRVNQKMIDDAVSKINDM